MTGHRACFECGVIDGHSTHCIVGMEKHEKQREREYIAGPDLLTHDERRNVELMRQIGHPLPIEMALVAIIDRLAPRPR